MKTRTFIISVFLVCFLTSISGQNPFFYSFDGQKISFKQLDSTVYIKFKDGLTDQNREKIKQIFLLHETKLSFKNGLAQLSQLYKMGHPDKILDLKKSEDIDYVDFVLQYKDGILQGLTNQIFIKFKDISYLDEIKKMYPIEKLDRSSFDNNVYVATLKKNSDKNAIEISKLLYESGKVGYSEPNFARFFISHTADPYFNLQWALKNTGQFGGTANADIRAVDAWNITKGSSCIKIAVLDEGVDLTHPDLQSNLLSGYDETGNGSNGGPSGNDAHGTNVAGIISSTENTIGVVGVAPQCKVIPIRIGLNGQIVDEYAIAGFRHAWDNAGADVISCSWGGGSYSQTVTDAINMAITNGRGNKGCVVIFSAGNSNSSVAFPGSLPNVIAVGATSMCDTRKRSSSNPLLCNPGVTPDPLGVSCDGENWWGSNYGSDLDVAAPGVHIYSTDIQGSFGYNTSSGTNGNYFETFNGTSAACPHVSATMALILSINPNLTQTQARQILESNTDKIGNYTYTTVSGHPNGTWNNNVGYGRINAYKALLATLAGQSISSTGTLLCSAGVTFTFNGLPSGCTITWGCSTNLVPVSINGNIAVYRAGTGANGPGYVQATVNRSGCGSYTLPQFVVWAGTPQITNQKVDGNSYSPGAQICPGNHWLNVTPVGGNAGTATWTVPGNIPYSVGTNLLNFTLPSSVSSVSITVRSANTCGTGVNWSFYLSKKSYGCSGYYSMTIYPNPASDNVTINIDEEISLITSSSDELGTVELSDAQVGEPITYTINIYNNQSSLLSSIRRSGKSFNVPLNNMRDGTYIIEVSDGKNSYRQPLIVKHN